MKRTSKHLLCLLLALAMVFSLAAPAFAEEADPETETVGFLRYDEDAEKFVEDSADCLVIDGSSATLSAGWYVVQGEVTVADRIEIDGEVNLILADGAKLTAQKGIHVAERNTLNIFAQTEGTGELIATAVEEGYAGIGGAKDKSCGSITIHGGTVTANGGKDGSGIGSGENGYGYSASITIYGGTVTANAGDHCAGIGGSRYGNSGTITIQDGTVTATGGNNAAGIGGGEFNGGCSITINGGDVTANGGEYGGAGIGGGDYGDGGSIKICGGTVKATGGGYAAGIGGGWNGAGGSVEINGGSVIAIAGHNAVGIGGGYESSGNGTLVVGENVVVKGGADKDSLEVLEAPFETRPAYMTVFNPMIPYLEYDVDSKTFTGKTAECALIDGDSSELTSGWYVAYGEVTIPDRIQIDGEVNLILADGAKLTADKGIHVHDPDSLTIYGQADGTGELIANAGYCYAAIGGDDRENPERSASGPVTIHGGIITATGGMYGAGIGGGNEGNGGTVTVYGGTVNATGGSQAAGIGGGVHGIGGTVTVYGGTVNATGGSQAAGIGGGVLRDGGSVTVYGGTVNATGGSQAAGIGGGVNKDNGTVTIYDGTVNATGGNSGAGIGGAVNGNGGTITILGGTIIANGGERAAGIGSGVNGNGGMLTISGGTVNATGGYSGAGIGSGVGGNGGTLTISGGTVNATGGDNGAGIGSGVSGKGGTAEISGGTVLAIGVNGGAGIGGSFVGVYDGVTITGGDVTAIGSKEGSGSYAGFAEGIGHGTSQNNSVPLTVGDFIVVKGGADADSLQTLHAPFETRELYMTAKIAPKTSFVWSWDGSEPTAVLKCLWPDGSEEDILADMSTTVADGVITYVSTAEVDGETYTASKSVNVEYTVEVINGTITSGAKDSYVYGDTIIVTAGAAPAGKSFAGWHNGAGELVSTSAVYGVAVDRDIVLEARYADVPVEIKPTLTASDTPREYDASTDKYKTVLSASWSVPQGYKLVEAGLIRAYAKAQPSKDTLINGGTKKASTLKKANGTYNLNISIGASKKGYGLYYVGYLTYKAPDGKTNTVYTEIGCNAPVS